MDLIDRDAFKRNNPRYMNLDIPYFCEDTVEDVLDAEPTVKAIPIEWIAKWMGKHQGLEHDGWNLAVGTMVNDWEKENDTNR